MSDEPTKYVLRPGMTLTISEPDEDGWENFSFGDKKNVRWIDAEDFRELFVPVSDLSRENQPSVASENLKQQIEASIVFACREYHEDYAINHGDARKRSEIVSCWSDRIVALIQGDSDV